MKSFEQDLAAARAEARQILDARVKRSGSSVARYMTSLQHDPCTYCGEAYRPGEWREIDHITARAHAGPNYWTNYTSACGPCNVGKSSGSLLEWLLTWDYFKRTGDVDGALVIRIGED